MAKTLFKGIQQVTWEYFNSPDLDKKGYLWFVREPQGENTGLGDDKFHIYFGTRCYGSFLQGERELFAASLEAVRKAIGLGDDFSFAWEGATTVSDAFELVKGWYNSLDTAVKALDTNKADKTALADYISDVKYTDSKIVFKNAEGEELASVDATPFIKDGMLNDVEIYVATAEDESLEAGEKYIKFTWNTDGEEKVDYILASEIGATYTGSDSIEISETNVISLKSADAELVQVDEIPVGGTPLANLLLENDITSISAGNLQAVLEALFSQNLWAEDNGNTPKRNVPTKLSVSMGNPTITFSKTGTQEVGTALNVTASSATASASASITYEGFDYGYSVENDNTRDEEGNPSSVSVTGTKDTDSDYKLTFVTNNGFGGVDIDDVAGSSLSATEMIVAEGTNKITVTAYSPTFTATVPAQDAVYACSSLKKTDDEHVVAASEASTITGAAITKTNNTSVTGAYYAFVGFSDTLPTTSDEYRAFASNGFSRLGKGNVTAGTCDKTYMAVCVPSGWDFTCNTSLGADMRGSFTETGDVTIILPNGDEKAYKYYALTYKDGAFKDLVIK
jgi:hypothetical protein